MTIYFWFTPAEIFARSFSFFLRQQIQKVRAFALHIRRWGGMMKRDDLQQGRLELLASAGVFAVQLLRVGVPLASDFADGPTLLKP